MTKGKFGTLGGVFVPSILTILGVIMYLRLPMIVGNVGLYSTIAIIIVAHIISATTGLSVSSIATDKKIKGGGTYYMISRSLGLPIGGSLGLALFVGLSFSVSLYLIGFAESFLGYWGFSSDINNIRLVGTIMLLVITIVTFISTSLAIKTQYFILTAIVLSIISIFLGSHDFAPQESLVDIPVPDLDIMLFFGIFFPAVTGFEAGVSMSGDLEDPKKSIPMGSIMAIVVGFVVYILLSIFLYFTVDSQYLSTDPRILEKIALVPQLVVIGIWGATLSSALGSILGAPRILQATAKDKIVHKFFAKGFGKANEPRNAILLTFTIAEIGILVGELNIIARIVSIFFITTYGFLNLSAAVENWTSSDYRPDFKVSPWVSLVGAIACGLVMIELDIVFMFIASFLLVLLFLYIKRRQLVLASGDTWSGVWYSLIRRGIQYLKKENIHERNWRPNIIQFSKVAKNTQTPLRLMGSSIAGDLGIHSVFNLEVSNSDILPKNVSSIVDTKDKHVYFSHTKYCKDIFLGMEEVIRSYGFSGINPNTILMGWTKQVSTDKYLRFLQVAHINSYNIIIQNYSETKGYGQYKSIDVWWDGSSKNFNFFIHLLKHLTTDYQWLNAEISVITIKDKQVNTTELTRCMNELLYENRINAEIKIIDNSIQQKSKQELIIDKSGKTDLLLYCLDEHTRWKENFQEIEALLFNIGSVLIVRASNEFKSIESIEKLSDADVLETDYNHVVLDLPDLISTKHNNLNLDIKKIDSWSDVIADEIYKRIFQHSFDTKKHVIQSFIERVDFTIKEYKKIDKVDGNARKRKHIDKLFGDTYFKWSTIKKDIFEDDLTRNYHHKEKQLSIFFNKLFGDYLKFPKKINLYYEKEDVQTFENDSKQDIRVKKWMRFKKSLGEKTYNRKVKYRKVAYKYLYANKLVFLKALMKKNQTEEEAFYQELCSMSIKLFQIVQHGHENTYLNTKDKIDNKSIVELFYDLKEEFNAFLAAIVAQENLMVGRLKYESRVSLNKMVELISKLDVNNIIDEKEIRKKQVNHIKTEIEQLPYLTAEKNKSIINLTHLDMLNMFVKQQYMERLKQFAMEVELLLQKNILELSNEIEDITKNNNNVENVVTIKFNETEYREVFTSFLDKIQHLLANYPPAITIPKMDTSKGENMHQIPLQGIADFYYKTSFEPTIQGVYEQLLDTIKQKLFYIKDIINHQSNITYALSTNEVKAAPVLPLDDIIKKTKEEIAHLNDLKTSIFFMFYEKLDLQFTHLDSANIEKNATHFTSGVKTLQSQKVLGNINHFVTKSTKYLHGFTTFISRLRNTSKALTSAKHASLVNKFNIRKLLELCESVNPKNDIISALPPYYVSLFGNKSNISYNYLVDRTENVAQIKAAYKRFNEGFNGGIIVVGHRNAGKTTLCRQVFSQAIRNVKTSIISPPLNGTVDINIFRRIVQHTFDIDDDIDTIFEDLKDNQAIIINDLELFWTNNKKGYDIINEIKRLIDKWSHKIFFVINTNPYAFNILKKSADFERYMIDIINITPFTASETKSVIMNRHKTTGLTVGYDTERKNLNPIKLSFLFNKIYNNSAGNPGVALNCWMNCIRGFSNGHLNIVKPKSINANSIQSIPIEWKKIIVEFVNHKRMTKLKIQNVIENISEKEVKASILGLLRTGIIVERTPNVYQINPYLYPYIDNLINEGVIY